MTFCKVFNDHRRSICAVIHTVKAFADTDSQHAGSKHGDTQYLLESHCCLCSQLTTHTLLGLCC